MSVQSNIKHFSIVIIVALVLGLAIGISIPRASEPIERTATLTRTIESKDITSTVTMTTTLTKTLSQQETNLNEYASTMSDIFSTFSDTAFEVGDEANAFSKGEISKNQFLSSIQSAKYETEELVEKAIRQQPPEKLTEAHVHYIKGLSLSYSSYILMEDGIILDDISLFKEATTLINLATDEIEFANKLIELAK